MGKRKWFRNGNLIKLLIGVLGAAVIAGYEYWVAEDTKKRRKRRKRKTPRKGGTKTKSKL